MLDLPVEAFNGVAYAVDAVSAHWVKLNMQELCEACVVNAVFATTCKLDLPVEVFGGVAHAVDAVIAREVLLNGVL